MWWLKSLTELSTVITFVLSSLTKLKIHKNLVVKIIIQKIARIEYLLKL